MLPVRAAQERLAAFRVPGWVERRVAALAELPPAPRRIGLALVGRDEAGRSLAPADASGAPYLAAAPLDALSAEARTSVFEAVFPHLGEPVELAWQLLQRLPYQAGPWRRAFRAPHNPAATLRARGWWLSRLRAVVEGYEQDVAWFAAWAPYLGYDIYPGYASPDALGTLFAAAIDGGGPEGEAVFDVLVASACGEHEVGAMGQHVVQGLLTAARPSGWALVESMLLRAEREEGLRQVILEAADEAHPEAFRSLLRLILEHHLARFSSVVRAADVWFGQLWEASSTRAFEAALGHVLRFLESAEARAAGLADPDPQVVSFALWATALADAEVAVPAAAALLGEADVWRTWSSWARGPSATRSRVGGRYRGTTVAGSR